jgi:cytochrome b6-f complex iron-sulfur subunit
MKPPSCPCCPQRRRFLQVTARSATALAFATPALSLLQACGSKSGSSSSPGTPIANSANNIYTLTFSQFSALQSAGGSVHVSVAAGSGTKDLYVTRISSTQAVAVSTVCTHAGCQLNSYDSGSQEYSCPCHGSVFSATGSVVQGPAGQALASYTGTIDSTGITFTIT